MAVRPMGTFASILLVMARDITRSALFYLIEGGQLARQKMALPLLNKGLLPGDDAILLCLKRHHAITRRELCLVTGLTPEGLEPRLVRLENASMILQEQAEDSGVEEMRLSNSGRRFIRKLKAQWRELDAVLLGDLKPKQRRRFRRTLDRFAQLLLL